jgi:hypothetical protein
MTLDLGNDGRGVFYLNFKTIGNGSNTSSCTREFNFGNLVEHANEYICAIERAVIPLHRLPYIYALIPAFQLQPTNIGLILSISTSDAFSLKEFIDDINSQCTTQGINLYISLNVSGRIRISFDNFANYNIALSDTLFQLFDTSTQIISLAIAPNNIVLGNSSILDRFDQLSSIQLEAQGLQSQQEIIDAERSFPIITDLIADNIYSLSYTEDYNAASSSTINISYSTRQTVVYNAGANRRFFNLIGSSPIQNIIVQAVAIFKNGSRNEITLPNGAIFSLKLAFYRK